MISSLANPSRSRWWTLFHLAFGFLATLGSLPVIAWFYIILAGVFYLLSFSAVNRPLVLIAAMAYLGGFEVMARMTQCSPFIPWEASKYLFLVFSILGIALTGASSRYRSIGVAIILLALPSVFFDKSGMTYSKEIVFNVLGIFNIGFGILFLGAVQLRKSDFVDLLRLAAFPCLCALAYTVVKTPDFHEIQFTLTAKLATSGEFGSNQVSTVLGFGFLLFSMSYIMGWRFSGWRTVDGFLALGFFMQGLLTFSRGGVLAASIALPVFLYFVLRSGLEHANIVSDVKRMAVPLLVFVVVSVFYINDRTGGNLFLRYQGETYGTQLGTRDRDFATFTSNRTVVFMDDLEIWTKYPVLGAGVGSSKHLRDDGKGIAAHVELSRLLAEHGLPGLMIFILFLVFGRKCLQEPDPLARAIRISLYSLAILTTFHSATRTFITPLLLSLCALQVIPDSKRHDPVPGQ